MAGLWLLACYHTFFGNLPVIWRHANALLSLNGLNWQHSSKLRMPTGIQQYDKTDLSVQGNVVLSNMANAIIWLFWVYQNDSKYNRFDHKLLRDVKKEDDVFLQGWYRWIHFRWSFYRGMMWIEILFLVLFTTINRQSSQVLDGVTIAKVFWESIHAMASEQVADKVRPIGMQSRNVIYIEGRCLLDNKQGHCKIVL